MMKKAKPTYGAPAGGQSQKISASRPSNTISTKGKEASQVQKPIPGMGGKTYSAKPQTQGDVPQNQS